MASYVSPKIRDKFESLSIDLKNDILKRNVHLETLQDLIQVREKIVKEGSRQRPFSQTDIISETGGDNDASGKRYGPCNQQGLFQ